MGKQTINTLVNSDAIWTSTVTVQAGHRYNTSIWAGSLASGAIQSTPTQSLASMSLCLERRMPNDDTYQWRVVKEWSVVSAAAAKATDHPTANEEYTSPYPEPEDCHYRMGCKETQYESGFLYIRVGTT